MWQTLEKPWQEAISLAWESYKKGTIPIGAVIVNDKGEIISKGRNQILDEKSNHPLAGTNMAHAEMIALFGLRAKEHPSIRNYILYTTLEPCPMCFGTAIMMNVRNIYYGADDAYAGAASINDTFDYIKSKKINLIKVGGELEAFQLILQSAYEYERKHRKIEEILKTWRAANNVAIDCGKEFHESGYFPQAVKDNKLIEDIYNEVVKRYLSIRTCPLCGGDNGCQHNRECWCFSTRIPKGLLEEIPREKRGKACVCKSCVDNYNNLINP